MDNQHKAVLMLMEAKRTGTSYKSFAAEAGIDLRKLYECSSPRRSSIMTDKMAQQILDNMKQLHPASYQFVMETYCEEK